LDKRLGRQRPRFSRAVSVALILVALVGAPMSTPTITRGDELSDAYAKQRALEQQIAQQKALLAALKDAQAKTAAALASTQAKLDEVNADLASAKAAVKDATVALSAATARYYELVGQVKLLHEQLLWLQATQDQKAAELKMRQDELAARLQAAYQDSHVPLLVQLLGSGSLNDVLVTISYNLTVGQQDSDLARRIAEDQATLASLEKTTSSMRAQTVELRDEAAAQRDELATQRQQLKEVQAKLQALQDETEALIAAQKARYAELASDAKKAADILAQQKKSDAALQDLIDRLLAQASGIPSSYSGSFIWPMSGTVTQWFGCTGFYWEPPLGSCAHFHNGIDIANTYGTPIRAAGDGVVIIAGRHPYDLGCGTGPSYVVVIAHASNLATWYVHIQTRIPVSVGQHVSQGQLIAYEGLTGCTTGPHLHWSVQLNGSWVNPRLFL
jgi:murein DD-endopeptidase MepM/ murein hydrolase activator NlpD